MANFVAVVDPDAGRRRLFLRQVRHRIDFLGDLTHGSVEAADFGAVWAVGREAPLDVFSDASEAVILFGEAIHGPRSQRLSARELRDRWCAERGTPAAFDGFHAAVWWSDSRGLVSAADLLGLFPVNYACRGDVIVVASSPELFRLHPLFPARLSAEGLLGVLLAHAVLDGLTILREVRRLPPAHALRWSPRRGAKSVRQHEIVADRQLDHLTRDEQAALLHGAYEDALVRHAPAGSDIGLLLSGGMDSRLIAGLLTRRGVMPVALTFGAENSYEADIAGRVARTLRLEHRQAPLGAPAFVEGAAAGAAWEHLAGGFSGVHTWGVSKFLRGLPRRCLNGQLLGIREILFGPTSREDLFTSPLQFGLRREQLRRAVRPELRGTLEGMCTRLERAWDAEVGDDPREHWRFALRYRSRAHPGGNLWRLSFGSWPILPLLDRELLAIIASAPASALSDRWWLRKSLRDEYPVLARLPLDRNSHDTMSLAAGPLRRAVNPLVVQGRRLYRALGGPRVERRSFHLLYDIDGEGWQSIRRLAEPQRDALKALFRAGEVDRLLPPPDVPIRPGHAIRDTFRLKLLLGLMLWSADHPL